jgi:hypothetical protein
MTPFVINLAKPYLKYMNNSLVDYGHPCGLIALIIVSVSLVFLRPFCPFNNAYSWNVLFGLLKNLEHMRILAPSILITDLSFWNISTA